MSTEASIRPAHFLLVEDDPTHADLMRIAFADNHLANTMDHVPDGVEALAYLRRDGQYANVSRPDVILLDLKLPKIDGHEVLRQIKADEDLKSIPVVMVTTSGSESDRKKAYDAHANSFLTKPLDFEKFRRMTMELQMYWAVWNQPPVNGRT